MAALAWNRPSGFRARARAKVAELVHGEPCDATFPSPGPTCFLLCGACRRCRRACLAGPWCAAGRVRPQPTLPLNAGVVQETRRIFALTRSSELTASPQKCIDFSPESVIFTLWPNSRRTVPVTSSSVAWTPVGALLAPRPWQSWMVRSAFERWGAVLPTRR